MNACVRVLESAPYFSWVAAGLVAALAEAGVRAELTESADDNDDRPCVAFIAHEPAPLPRNCIAYNLEQLGGGRSWPPWLEPRLRSARAVWDYAASNVRALAARGIAATHVPLGFCEAAVGPPAAPPAPARAAAALFVGCLNARRRAALARFPPGRVTAIESGCWGADLAREMARHRVGLNLHFYNRDTVLEVHRIVPMVAAGLWVLTEPSDDAFYDAALAGCVDFARAEDMPARLEAVLALPVSHARAELAARRARLPRFADAVRGPARAAFRAPIICESRHDATMSLVVVDDFLNNARDTRAFALTLPFEARGNYPGARTFGGHAPRHWIPVVERYLPADERVTWWDTHPLSYNGAFQLCDASDGGSWIHRDATDWAGILFLTPDAPASAGLSIYRHPPTRTDDARDINAAEAEKRASRPEEWEEETRVGNRFNRLVLFRCSRHFHKASAYFGAPGECDAARLFQVLFFNTTSPPLLQRWTAPPRPPVRVAILALSTNRYDYLETTLRSMDERLSLEGCEVTRRLVVDDWPAGRDGPRMAALAARHHLEVRAHDANLGLPTAWATAWQELSADKAHDFVLQIEDDVEFVRDMRLIDVLRALVECPRPLCQVALRRQVCYERSRDLFARIDAGEIGEPVGGVIVQPLYFMTMASVFARDVHERLPRGMLPQEHTAREYYARAGLECAVLGGRGDAPHVMHRGLLSRGIKGPGFEHLPLDADYAFDTGR